jgi:hypothetical protein
MKKFSNISGSQVGEESKEEVKINEEDLFKLRVLNLMEQLLTIRTYGPVDRYLRAGSIKISGKELFLEALMDILKDKSVKDEKAILESLKSSINDWETIDNKIEEANQKVSKSDKMSRNKIRSLFSLYGHDEELLINMVGESCNKITKHEIAQLRAITAESMINDSKLSKDLLKKVSEKFNQRAQELLNEGSNR